MNFETLLKKWNDGIARGAAARLAVKLDIAPNTVSAWVNAKATPGPELRPQVAKVLGISLDDLERAFIPSTGALVVRESEPEYKNIKRTGGFEWLEIPDVGTVSASRLSSLFDLPPESFLTMAIKGPAGTRYVALRVSGDCMEPEIGDGDTVIVRQTDHAEDGSIAVVCWDGDCELRWLYRTKDGVELVPENPRHKVIKIASSKARVLGVVTDINRKPRKRRR